MPRYRSLQTLASVSPRCHELNDNESCIGTEHVASHSAVSDCTGGRHLRIAIVTENFQIPIADGVTRTLARLLEHLQSEGHSAIVLGPATGTDIYAGAKIWGTIGIPLFCYPSLKLAFLRPAFINHLIAFKPDVIHFVDPVWLGAQTLPAVEHYLPNVPRVSSYHTNLATYTEMFGFGFLKKPMWRWNKYLHNKCRAVFCPSPSTSTMLQRQGLNNVRIWSRGVDLNDFSPRHRSEQVRQSWIGPSRHKIVLLYVGRLSWEKNLRLLIDAFKEMDQNQVHLVFVGEGPAKSELEKYVAGLSVTFLGHLRGQDLTTAYASADIFAFPSYSETFGQVVLEALASGLPVVGLRAEGVRDLVTHTRTGFLLDITVSSAEEFALATAVNTPALTFASTPSIDSEEGASPSPLALTPIKAQHHVPDFTLDAAQQDYSPTSLKSTFDDLEGRNGLQNKEANGDVFAAKLELAIASLNSDMRAGFSKSQASSRRPSTTGLQPVPAEKLDFMPFDQQIIAYRSLLQILVDDVSTRHRMSLSARESAKKHSWHEAMEALVNGYRSVLEPVEVDTARNPSVIPRLWPTASSRDNSNNRSRLEVDASSPSRPQAYHPLAASYTSHSHKRAICYNVDSKSGIWARAAASVYHVYIVWILMGIGGHRY